MEQQAFQSQHGVDTRLPFRTGWPILPALPVKTWPQDHNLPTLLPDWERNIAQIHHIMAQNDVWVVDAFLCYRYNKGVPESERKPTFLIYSDLREEGQKIEIWRRAAGQVGRMFQQQRITNVAVEIVDVRVNEDIKTEIILPCEKEVLDTWTELAPRIAEYLSNHNWISLDLLHRSWIGAQEDAKATVVISAADANDSQWWDQTMPTLRALLPSFLGIELVYLDTILAMDDSASSESDQAEYNILEDKPYDLPHFIQMGASCGPKWKGKEEGPGCLDGRSGTLGGLVKFKDLAQQFGVSNHHVFFEGKDPHNKNDKVLVVSPSNADHQHKLQELDRKIGGATQKYKIYEQSMAQQSVLDWTQSEIEQLNSMKERVQSLDRYIGTIYASSGEKSIPNQAWEDTFWGLWESDWCLIQIIKEKTLAESAPLLAADKPPTQATTYQSISPYKLYDVMKFGKTSGRTFGIVSAALTVLRKQGDPLPPLPRDPARTPSVTLYKQPNVRVLPKSEGPDSGSEPQTRICYAIRSRRQSKDFMQAGDSGCIVLLDPTTNNTPPAPGASQSAPIVGLGFGHNTITGTAYMMPFDLVVNDIQEETGRTIVQPKDAGEAQPRA